MIIFCIILVFVGLYTDQPRRFWTNAGAAVAFQLIVFTLFSGGGTLQDPRGDGLTTAVVRRATNDGPQMFYVALVVIALAWGVPGWLISRGYQKKPRPGTASPPPAGAPRIPRPSADE
jgi:hypothetical protein